MYAYLNLLITGAAVNIIFDDQPPTVTVIAAVNHDHDLDLLASY